MYINGQQPIKMTDLRRGKAPDRRVRVDYSVSARLPMLHGGFLPHTFNLSAKFSVPGDEFSESAAKAQLETLLIRKFRARRIRWAKFEVIEID